MRRADRPGRGSSPLARGTHAGVCLAAAVARFIPAGAGNTSSTGPSMSNFSVHPRWRGEHPCCGHSAHRFGGSSPLARGTPVFNVVPAGNERCIPAGAGNTKSHHGPHRQPAVHPRWRGEHPESYSTTSYFCGSSPLARGTLQEAKDWMDTYWFIPAGAGNTRMERATRRHRAVHPRWRGEHLAGLW